jgi:hypothetical protein
MAGRRAREIVAVTRQAVLELDPTTYRRHALHAEERVWVEKNCYIDIWLELVHALGLEPEAMLPFVVALDFEGDQWTFFKPPHGELFELYGLDVQELNMWRPLLEHARTHLAEGRLISTEADAFWLPDTAGTDYRRQHTKTTIVINDLDVEGRRLGYFHNAAYHALEGEDFVQTFRLGFPPDPAFMPLFAEFVRLDRMIVRSREELRDLSRQLLRRHLARRPAANPVTRFAARFAHDLAWIQDEGLAFYHAWAFATVRQLGAAFELAAWHLRWLGGHEAAAASFDRISNGAKTFILKAARAVNAKRPLDSALLDELAGAWQDGMMALEAA